ncbi:MAG TPA: hypothetical protein DFI00_07435 [Rhodospirillaceae bacterium]|nr:hypothetical protein [Rhodospirillaceae bacterium]
MALQPIRMTEAGNTPQSRVSPYRSKPHLPRVILRTTAPAKLLACQSEEKRWTRRNASLTICSMHFGARRIHNCSVTCFEAWNIAMMAT